MKSKILILGGTSEAVELAKAKVLDGHDVITSLAGRTKEPVSVAGQTRIGGFGGAQGLANYLKEHQIDLLIDCTHPFAKQISANARKAADLTDTKLQVRTRPKWKRQEEDRWQEVENLDAACSAIPSNSRVLLAIGSQHITAFQRRDDVFFIVRMVDEPSKPLALANYELLLGKPPLDWYEEKKILERHAVSHIVCRNSGGPKAYAKIEAARAIGLPVIIVDR